MKKTLMMAALAMSMATTASAQTQSDVMGFKSQQQTLTYFDGVNRASAKATAEELLGCPQGTVFGGEYKEEKGAWTGNVSADEGRKDVSTSFYQHFTDCYYKFSGVRVLGIFNYFDSENIRWIYCRERGGINDGDMTKPIKMKVAFYNDNGEDGLPGDLVYSKVFDVIGERTGVEVGNSVSGTSCVYAFNFDLGEEINMEHGFMQVNAVDENDESIVSSHCSRPAPRQVIHW